MYPALATVIPMTIIAYGSSFSPVPSRGIGGAYTCGTYAVRVSAPIIAPGTGSPNHDNRAIGGDPSDSYEQERRSGLEYSSRKLIVS
jgi:hypothetical protein